MPLHLILRRNTAHVLPQTKPTAKRPAAPAARMVMLCGVPEMLLERGPGVEPLVAVLAVVVAFL